MNKAGQFISVFCANLAWFLSCLPRLLLFILASFSIKRQQEKILRGIMKPNANSAYGMKYGFGSIRSSNDIRQIPLSEYEEYSPFIEQLRNGGSSCLTVEPIHLLQPTSGSVSATKLIPYTQSLKKQFAAAIDPWIGFTYLHYPRIFGGRHYWSISPSTHHHMAGLQKIPVGFAEDAEYLGVVQRQMAKTLFAVPAEISRVSDPEAFQYLTLLFLIGEKHLRLISVWHPSFLAILVDAMAGQFPDFIRDIGSGVINQELKLASPLRQIFESQLQPDPVRAAELACLDCGAPGFPMKVWPELHLISCWTEGLSDLWVSKLRRWFPLAFIQGKGLVATEGIVSIPIDSSRKACAVGSHFYEFVDSQSGGIKRVWELENGHEYSVVLTTGGGLYRYRLHDLVQVTGHYHQVPCFEFIAKDNLVSDLVGEKLNSRHVEESIRRVEEICHVCFEFALLAPGNSKDYPRYDLYVQPDSNGFVDFPAVAVRMEEELKRNYHYHHARQLGQLQPLKVFHISGQADVLYRRHMIARGMKPGDIKIYGLSLDSSWASIFNGEYVT